VRKINTKDIEERSWTSPKGNFGGTGKHISQALGRDPFSTDIKKRHPFDIEICRVPPGKANCPYHSHSAQWEFYHVIAGRGLARHQDGITPIETGDAFLFEPGEPHQLSITAQKTFSMFSSRIIQSANLPITQTAGNGWCAHPKRITYAPKIWSTTMERSDEIIRECAPASL